MKPSKAVELMLGGAVLTEGTMYIRIKDGRYEVNSVTNRIDGGGWLPASDFNYDYLSDESLTIAQPKSAIEEAIDREVAGGVYMPNGDVQFRMRRIVNITLDEAKKAVSNYGDCGYSCVVREAHKRIDALKVKI